MSATATRSVPPRMRVVAKDWLAADVGGDVLFVEIGIGGDGSDDVAGAAERQPLPAAVEQ